jgi:DNA-binding IclR family transcriptional regulator
MSSAEPYPGTQAVLRAIALLKAFTDDAPELGLADLARQAGLNKTTTYRLLTALESEGMVARTPAADTFRLGPEAIVLGGRALRANDLRAVSQPALAALARQVGEATTLEVLVDTDVLILLEIPGSHLVSTNQAVGTRWPVYATSTGKAMLAHLPPLSLQAILAAPFTPLTPCTITNPAQLSAELTQIRDQGYALANQEIEIGFMAVGAPLFDHTGQPVAAISVNGPTARLTLERVPTVAALVKTAAAQISEMLGFKGF